MDIGLVNIGFLIGAPQAYEDGKTRAVMAATARCKVRAKKNGQSARKQLSFSAAR
jgi:hypothetical protein